MDSCLHTAYFATVLLEKDCFILCSKQEQSWLPAEYQVYSHNKFLFAFKAFSESELDLVIVLFLGIHTGIISQICW